MSGDLPEQLANARDKLLRFKWDFSDEIDAEELQSLTGRSLIHKGDHFDRELSSQEEEETRAIVPGAFVVQPHLGELGELFNLCYNFFVELTQAGYQHILAERAQLPSLPIAQRPTTNVCFGPVPLPDPLPLSYLAWERAAGSPHVLGARLLWWGAAAECPAEFGYECDFRSRFQFLPIWTFIQDHVGYADVNPVNVIKLSVQMVCELLEQNSEQELGGATSRATTRQLQEEEQECPLDGPQQLYTESPHSGVFWYRGTSIPLRGQTWKLISLLWENTDRPVPFLDIAERLDMGSDWSDSTIRSMISRLNRTLLDGGIHLSWCTERETVRLNSY